MSSPPIRKRPLVRDRREYPLAMIESGQHILAWLGALRFATGTQVQRLIFDRTAASPRMARHRATRSLRRLFDAGFIRRVEVLAPLSSGRPSRQIVNVLTAKGAAAVGLDAATVRRRSPQRGTILIHEFWVVEVLVVAVESCPTPLAVTQLWNDRELSARKRRQQLGLANIPDALFLICNQQTGITYPCFLELDLGTESVQATRRLRSDIARKIEGYLDYFFSPTLFNQEFEVDGRPIVLLITHSDRRLASMRHLVQQLGGGGRFWFSTLQQVGGSAKDSGNRDTDFAARQGAFWTTNWVTAHDGQLRSLATRCGL